MCAAEYVQLCKAKGGASRRSWTALKRRPEGKWEGRRLPGKNALLTMLSPARQKARPPASVACPQTAPRGKRGSRRLPGKMRRRVCSAPHDRGRDLPYPWTALKRRPEESGEAGACPGNAPLSMLSPARQKARHPRIRGLPSNGGQKKAGKLAPARKKCVAVRRGPSRVRRRVCSAPHGRGRDLTAFVDCPSQAADKGKRGSWRLPGKNAPPRAEAPRAVCAAEYAQPRTAEGETSRRPWTAPKRRPEERGEAGACPEKMRRHAPRPPSRVRRRVCRPRWDEGEASRRSWTALKRRPEESRDLTLWIKAMAGGCSYGKEPHKSEASGRNGRKATSTGSPSAQPRRRIGEATDGTPARRGTYACQRLCPAPQGTRTDRRGSESSQRIREATDAGGPAAQFSVRSR